MKKVLIVNTKYKIFGGEDANISDEINLLKKQYNIELLEFDNSQRINIVDLIAFVTNSNRNANKKLTKSLNEFKPDAVYVHNTWFKGNLGIFKILRDKEIPIIHKLHNFRYDCSRHYLASNHYRNVGNCNACYFDKSHKIFNKYYKDSYLKSFFLIRYSKKLFKIFLNYPIKLLVISQFHKNYLVTLGIPSTKIEVYLNPINISEQNIDVKKSNYVVYAGRLNTEKGIENLLDCWSEAKPNNIALKVIGSGDIEERLKEKYKNDSILFLGNLSNQDAKLEISKARAVITATKMYEGQPRLLCEASSFGVPSIYPSFGGMDEFFPSAYEFSFNQYDYRDLKDKIKKINNDELLSKTGIAVKKHMSKILHPEVQLASFDSYLLDRWVTSLNPKISVLMSVKNSELTVSTSIESILRQSYTNYEFLIIDDASTDNTHKILKKYEEKDSRIKIFQNRENQGLTKSLNILIGFTNGEYIARQDSDDESMVDRLQMQYDYLVKKKLDACATRSISMQSNRIIPGLSFYISPRILVNFKNPMVHGTLLISRKVLEELHNYDERFYYSQDYKLIYDLLKSGYKFKIVDEVLYRLNTVDNISNKFKNEQSYYAKCVRKKSSPET